MVGTTRCSHPSVLTFIDSDEAGEKLARAMKQNNTLLQLDVNLNDFDYKR